MEEKKEFIINLLYFALIFGLVYVFIKYLLPIVAPFLVGFLLAYIALKLSKKLFKKDNKAVRIISLIIIYVVFSVTVVLLLLLGISKVTDFLISMPTIYKNYIEPALNSIEKTLIDLNSNLPIDIKTDVNAMIVNIGDSIGTLFSSFASNAVSVVTSLISNTTSVLLISIETIVSSFFFVADFENIISYLTTIMSKRTLKIYNQVQNYIHNTLFLVLKSYGTIMLVTFLELFIGLMLIGIDNFGVLAMLIAILDILPILGVGTVLIPWGLICLLLGNTKTGILILILYVIITAIRNVIEPKLVGGDLEIHPLVTLASMVTGLAIFGGVGMFGLPLTISFFVKRSKNELG